MANKPDDKALVAEKSRALADAILAFRDAANGRRDFVRYKVLVGFESVYPGHWEDFDYDFKDADEYRQKQAAEFIESINATNEDEWFDFLSRCAETKSNDMATFPVFGQFLVNLSKAKPEIAERMLARAGTDLRNFTAGFLNGLAVSNKPDIYDRVLERELSDGKNLAALARHLRYSDVRLPAIARRILDKALASHDDVAVIESLLFCMEHIGSGKIDDEERFFAEAMGYLNERHDRRWLGQAWFVHGRDSQFFANLNKERAALILKNLEDAPRVDHQIERLLKRVAEKRLEDVWDYFGRRILRERTNDDGGRFDAVPFQFHGLEKTLSRDPAMAIQKGKIWYAADNRLFRFRGGRLLSNAFPSCSPEFGTALKEVVESGSGEDADFVLAILQNYLGEPATHDVLKAIVARYSEDAGKLARVGVALDNTGVVQGEFGFVEAYRAKKDLIKGWLKDERPQVRAYAEEHLRHLDNRIASETRNAENDTAMRRLRYGGSEPEAED